MSKNVTIRLHNTTAVWDWNTQRLILYTVLQNNYAYLILSELRQFFTNFDNVWQKDGKDAKIMRGSLTFHLTRFVLSQYRVKRRCTKLLHNAESCLLQ